MIFNKKFSLLEFSGGLVVKNLVLSLLWLGFSTWSRTFASGTAMYVHTHTHTHTHIHINMCINIKCIYMCVCHILNISEFSHRKDFNGWCFRLYRQQWSRFCLKDNERDAFDDPWIIPHLCIGQGSYRWVYFSSKWDSKSGGGRV